MYAGWKMDIKRLPSQALVLFLPASNCFNHFQFNFTRVCKHDMWRQYPLATVGWPMSWPTTITQNSTDHAVPGPKNIQTKIWDQGLRIVKHWGKWREQQKNKSIKHMIETTAPMIVPPFLLSNVLCGCGFLPYRGSHLSCHCLTRHKCDPEVSEVCDSWLGWWGGLVVKRFRKRMREYVMM